MSVDYSALPSDDAAFLREKKLRITDRFDLTQKLICEMGQELLEAQDRLPHIWGEWIASELPFSVDTALNYIKVYRNLQDLPVDVQDEFNARALYIYARDDVTEDRVQLAIERAQQGVKQDYQESYINSYAPMRLLDRYHKGEVAKNIVYALSVAIKQGKYSAQVISYALAWNVANIDLFEGFNRLVGTATWETLINDEGVLNGVGWSLPASQATERDLHRLLQDRASMHRLQALEPYDDVKTKAQVIVLGDGQRALILPDDIPLQDFDEGDTVTVFVRLLKKHEIQKL